MKSMTAGGTNLPGPAGDPGYRRTHRVLAGQRAQIDTTAAGRLVFGKAARTRGRMGGR